MDMDVKYNVIHEIGDMIVKKEKKKREPHKLVIINEEELIRQVELRPMLYDKSLKGYRKSALRDQCWKEIAASVNSTVEKCRKRWRSLRDAFAKHYKQIDITMNSKKKKWIFYDQMYFIAPYLDCSNSGHESADMSQLQDNSHESILLNTEEHLDGTEESSDFKSHIHHHHHHHHQQENDVSTGRVTSVANTIQPMEHVSVENVHPTHIHHIQHHQENDETTTATTHISAIDLNDGNNQFVARIFTTAAESSTEYDGSHTITTTAATAILNDTPAVPATTVVVSPNTNNLIDRKPTTTTTTPAATGNNVDGITLERCDDYTTVSTTDPDERFLLSCAPILKRLTNKKNALARLRIQQILYNIEFGDQCL